MAPNPIDLSIRWDGRTTTSIP